MREVREIQNWERKWDMSETLNRVHPKHAGEDYLWATSEETRLRALSMKDVMLTSIPAIVVGIMFSLLFYGFLIYVA